jgi:hypothetical protein
MNQEDTLDTFKIIKNEMTSTWVYLDAYTKIFESSDDRYIKTFEETSPVFFALVQTSLMESAFSRIARLMDPKESRRKENLSFARLCDCCSEQEGLQSVCDDFTSLTEDWKNGIYRNLREHSNQVHSHNDFLTISNAQPFVTSRMTANDVLLIQNLFDKLWSIVSRINQVLFNTTLLKPTYNALNQKPNAFFSYLDLGRHIKNNLSDHPELQNIVLNTLNRET